MQNKKNTTTVLITGAAQRLGKAIACACADNGLSVIIHYNRSKVAAEKLCNELAEKAISAIPLQADLANIIGYDDFIKKAIALSEGSLGGIINNAATFPADTIDTMTYDSLNAALRINAWAPLALSRAFARHVHSGSIVNILDSRLPKFDRTHCSYSLSKHLFYVITMLCASEFAPKIRVNAVAPGLILPPAGETDAYVENLINKIPLHKKGTADDVAQAVIFLLRNNYITGEIIYVDGGRNAVGTQNP